MADTELPDLPARATPALTDIAYLVSDPTGTPADHHATLAAIQALMSGLVKIEELTPTGTNATFSALGAFTHLKIVYKARGDVVATSALINLTFNGDTGNNYDGQRSSFTTATALSEQLAQASVIIGVAAGSTAPANYFASGEILIPHYRGGGFKTAQSQANLLAAQSTGNVFSRLHSAFWRNVAAITSVTLTLSSGNFVTDSTVTLYGMK